MIYFNSKQELSEFLTNLRSAGIRCAVTQCNGRYVLQIR